MEGRVRHIFVSIPSYKDPASLKTVRNCLSHAAQPGLVHIFVCEQNDREPSCASLASLAAETGATLSVDAVPASVAQGPCYARARIECAMLAFWEQQPWYNDAPDPIVFMIDAHTLFANGWDDVLRQEMQALPANGVLSHYPKSYLGTARPCWNPDPRRTLMQIKRRNGDGIYLFEYKLDSRGTEGLVLSKGLAAGCLAFHASVMYEVPYLQHVPYLFIGEEMCTWMRLFCAGYDVFTPSRDIIQTTFVRSGRPSFSAQSRQHTVKLAKQRGSTRLVQELMGLAAESNVAGASVVTHEWRDAFFKANECAIVAPKRSKQDFVDMLARMHAHRGPMKL